MKTVHLSGGMLLIGLLVELLLEQNCTKNPITNKNQIRGMNKYYSNCLDVYLHFLLVVEVIKLNRILDLWMTLDATYCDVQLIYGLAEIS